MEENLRKLLKDLINEETTRKDTMIKNSADIEQEKERLNFREQNEIERFVDGFKQDIEAGLYNNTNQTEIQRMMNDAKNSITERYNREREQLNQKLEDIKKENEDSKSNGYKQINSAIKEYHIEMVLESSKAKSELVTLEEERDEKLNEINKKIAEKEARRTHMIIRNREFMDIDGTQISADIRILGIEIEQLREEKQVLSGEYDAKIETQSQHMQYCTDQKEKAAKLLGQILSAKQIEEVYQELFGKEEPEEVIEEEQPVEVVEEEQQVEVVEEEQPVEVVEEEQPAVVEEEQPAVVEEEQPVEVVEEEQPVEVVEEQPQVEVVEEEQPVEAVEEEQPAVVEEEQPPVVVEKKPPVVKEQPSIVTKIEQPKVVQQKQPVVKEKDTQQPPKDAKRTISEDEKNYEYFENNRKNIVDWFMYATGVKEKEAAIIFSDMEHCKAVGKIAEKLMINRNNKAEIIRKFQSYYSGIDSRLDIEVSSKGIRYNDEEIEPLDITLFGEDENEEIFINKIYDKFDQVISAATNGKIVYDRNIVKAIAMDNNTVDSKGKMKLTMSGNKKLNQYLRIIADPKQKNGSVTYDLEKVSLLRSFLNISTWSPRKVLEIKKLANKVRNSYATTKPGIFTKYQWAIQDWFKGLKTKKITAGEQEILPKLERINPWKISQTRGLYEKGAQERTDKDSQETKQKTTESEEVELG